MMGLRLGRRVVFVVVVDGSGVVCMIEKHVC